VSFPMTVTLDQANTTADIKAVALTATASSHARLP